MKVDKFEEGFSPFALVVQGGPCAFDYTSPVAGTGHPEINSAIILSSVAGTRAYHENLTRPS